ncbi:aminopeptidase N [Nocardioides flavescens]|uniref:Aminopeptidase N n=1 Tax=Nocardioides flavescens TaxID=2691959 RepID=A0A6L7F4J4_9ACTN|nr:aminopeptidase N [Nocardioides flavescens]MXG92124.1 aminopeptidase N [Nocardioides flavescens]
MSGPEDSPADGPVDVPADAPASLTQDEARARAELLDVERYDIEVDLRELLAGERWRATSRVTFTCRRPGADTFVDVVGEVHAATLNGVELDASAHRAGRLALTGLAERNELVVVSSQTDTGSGNAILRTVDGSDDRVYVWTSFEPDGARRAWACFDQPDLKAVHRFRVVAPAEWSVLSNSAPDQVSEPTAVDDADHEAGLLSRWWSFTDTPRLSTYVVVVNAGPFHEVREQRGGHSLGLWCRQSLRPYLERDTAELLRLTEAGLAFFGERFDQPFGQERYDHVFVPDMGGAMENWGCVTWSDSALHRGEPTLLDRMTAADTLLHEMAHMWFGDLVTMRWWDDLWLNEAFASFAATWALDAIDPGSAAWAVFAATDELVGYEQDRGPARHPIRTEVPDVAHAMANFDAITYLKGQAVLRQLMELLGEERFVAGLRAHFAEHAWGNATLAELMSAFAAASGRELDGWTAAWLDRAGTDTVSLVGDTLLVASPDGGTPRPHALLVGSYARSDAGLSPVGSTRVETAGAVTSMSDLPEADLQLVNDGDLSFVSVRPDEASLQVLLTDAGRLPDATGRVVAVSTALDMLAEGELSSGDVFECVVAVLEHETVPGLVEPLLARALAVAEQWSPTVLVPRRLERLARLAGDLADHEDSGADVRAAALQTLAWAATTSEHFDRLDAAVAAAPDDTELAWLTLTRRAALDRHDQEAVDALLGRDPDPEARVRALGVAAARPSEEAKAEAWEQFWRAGAVPSGVPTRTFARCFWRPAQHDLLVPWAHRFLDELSDLNGEGLLAVGSKVRLMAPTTCDVAWLDRARDLAEAPDALPAVRTALLVASDRLARVLAARA